MANEVVCTRCKEVLPREAFSPHPAKANGLRSACRQCSSSDAMKWRDQNREKVLNTHLLRNYGISLEQYRELYELQEGRCAICNEAPDSVEGERRRQGFSDRLVVDHDHETDAVRGLLCAPCNRALGHFKDSTAVLHSAISYLEQSRE